MYQIDINNVLNGIRAELNDSKKYYEFEIKTTAREDTELYSISLDLSNSKDKLDETLESSTIWWRVTEKETGTAEILKIVPEDEKIYIKYLTNIPPSSNSKIKLFPPEYLKPILIAWQDEVWAAQCLSWIENNIKKENFNEHNVLDTKYFPWLRENQKKIFEIMKYKAAFLQGPPGTGKTTTLGALLATYLSENPYKKVLLLSTTNLAVDEALISLDKSLHSMGNEIDIQRIQDRIFRIGNNFISSYYKDREYLLPVKNEQLIKDLIELQMCKPDISNMKLYSKWIEKEKLLKQLIKDDSEYVLKSAGLVAMTITRAAFILDELKENSPYDLIVFDESSQIGLSHALIFAPLGENCLFAGDPNQLSPVNLSNNEYARKYLGESIFALTEKHSNNLCFLNEQSRMRQEINDLISYIFYDGELKLAQDKKNNNEWLRERDLDKSSLFGTQSIIIEKISNKPQWSQKYHGEIHYESAKCISEIVEELELSQIDFIILTPFKSQRTLINSMLRQNKNKHRAKTVHKSQGSEFHTVIFDPVKANHNFLDNDNGKRLINVALSRAKARLIILSREGDENNDIFKHILNFNTITNEKIKFKNVKREIFEIANLILNVDFPENCLNKTINFETRIGKVIRIDQKGKKEATFIIIDSASGEEKKILINFLKNKYSKN